MKMLMLILLGITINWTNSFAFKSTTASGSPFNILMSPEGGVDPISGAAVISYPLVNMTGRGGLGLNVALSYSSNSHLNARADNITAPTSWVGLGWGLIYGSIKCIHNGTASKDDDEYVLVSLSGAVTKLHEIDTDEFITDLQPYTTLKRIELVSTPGVVDGWIITDLSGVRSVYGDISIETDGSIISKTGRNANEYDYKIGKYIGIGKSGSDNPALLPSAIVELFPVQWNLSEVRNTFGDYVEYIYEKIEDEKVVQGGWATKDGNGNDLHYTKASYISEIKHSDGRRISFTRRSKGPDEYVDAHNATNLGRWEGGAVGDVDNDGEDELVFVYATGMVRIYDVVSNPYGYSSLNRIYEEHFAGKQWREVEIGDIDDDGNADDIVISSNETVEVLTEKQDILWWMRDEEKRLKRLDKLYYFTFNSQTPVLEENAVFSLNKNVRDFTIGDLDADGCDDIVAVDTDGLLTIYSYDAGDLVSGYSFDLDNGSISNIVIDGTKLYHDKPLTSYNYVGSILTSEHEGQGLSTSGTSGDELLVIDAYDEYAGNELLQVSYHSVRGSFFLYQTSPFWSVRASGADDFPRHTGNALVWDADNDGKDEVLVLDLYDGKSMLCGRTKKDETWSDIDVIEEVAVINSEPDGYMEKYATDLLNEISTFNENGILLTTYRFRYDVMNHGKYAKTLLKAITCVNSESNERTTRFTYYEQPSEDNSSLFPYGALSGIKQEDGRGISYSYTTEPITMPTEATFEAAGCCYSSDALLCQGTYGNGMPYYVWSSHYGNGTANIVYWKDGEWVRQYMPIMAAQGHQIVAGHNYFIFWWFFEIKIAQWNGNEWVIGTIEGDTKYDVGETNIRIVPGNNYFALTYGPYGSNRLNCKMFNFIDGEWKLTDIDGNSVTSFGSNADLRVYPGNNYCIANYDLCHKTYTILQWDGEEWERKQLLNHSQLSRTLDMSMDKMQISPADDFFTVAYPDLSHDWAFEVVQFNGENWYIEDNIPGYDAISSSSMIRVNTGPNYFIVSGGMEDGYPFQKLYAYNWNGDSWLQSKTVWETEAHNIKFGYVNPSIFYSGVYTGADKFVARIDDEYMLTPCYHCHDDIQIFNWDYERNDWGVSMPSYYDLGWDRAHNIESVMLGHNTMFLRSNGQPIGFSWDGHTWEQYRYECGDGDTTRSIANSAAQILDNGDLALVRFIDNEAVNSISPYRVASKSVYGEDGISTVYYEYEDLIYDDVTKSCRAGKVTIRNGRGNGYTEKFFYTRKDDGVTDSEYLIGRPYKVAAYNEDDVEVMNQTISYTCYTATDWPATIKQVRVSSTSKTVDGVETIQENSEYNNSNGMPTVTKTTNSDGTAVIKKTWFACEEKCADGSLLYPDLGNGADGQMNMVLPSRVVTYEGDINSTSNVRQAVASSYQTVVNQNGNSVYVPGEQYVWLVEPGTDGALPAYNEYSFESGAANSDWSLSRHAGEIDEYGNLVTVRSLNGNYSHTIYCDEGMRPIATLNNCGPHECGYSGFENGELNSWNEGNAFQITDDASFTGDYSYHIQSTYGPTANFFEEDGEEDGIDKSCSYILSAWVKYKSGTPPHLIVEFRNSDGGTARIPVSETADASKKGWQYVECEVTPAHMQNAGFNGTKYLRAWVGNHPDSEAGESYVDDIRFHPNDALVRTMTYNEDGTVSSTTDALNRVARTVRDSWGRTFAARNHDMKIQSYTTIKE